MKCTKCGEELSGISKYCPKCNELTPNYLEARRQAKERVRMIWIIGGVFVLFLVCLFIGMILYNNLIVRNQLLNVLEISGTDVPTRVAVTPGVITPPECLEVGQTWVSSADGMTMTCVPAATFPMGSDTEDPDRQDDEQPQHRVSLDAFWVAQTEVTNRMFAEFVTATGYQTDAEREGWGIGYQSNNWTTVLGASWEHPQGSDTDISGLEDHPVVMVSWWDAEVYCRWAGMTLLTEAQWELAARGTDGRVYPWGNNPPDGTLMNYADNNFRVNWADLEQDDGYRFTAPVGSYQAGVSPYGVLDLSGNVWEWTADWYGEDYYEESPAVNPPGASSGQWRVIRGGAWDGSNIYTRAAFRNAYEAEARFDNIGFRCGISAP
jgi:formylglycine-generating enzyme required for sulfatase activity